MSDNLFSKVVKGVAKLGASYMSSTADSLSRNSNYSDEQRNQFREVHDAFSDISNKLNNINCESTSDYNDYSEYYEDDCNYDEQNSSTNNHDNCHIEKCQNNDISSHFNQITFAEHQWYVIHRNTNYNTALLLSKEMVNSMIFFPKYCKKYTFENSSIYEWLNHQFLFSLKSKLKNNDQKRLLSVSLLSSIEFGTYIPTGILRRADSEWWLRDIEDGKIKYVTKKGHIQLVKANKHGQNCEICCGVRPVIVIRLKEKQSKGNL